MLRPPTYPRLRVRRLGGGFHREDVLFAVRELEDTLRRMEAELEGARTRSRDLEAELKAAQAEAAVLRAREFAVTEAMAAAERRAREIEESAQAQSRAVLAQAEEQAAKIRGDAHLKVGSTASQLEELLALKGKTVASMRSIVGELDRAIGRIERGETEPPAGLEPAVATSQEAPTEPPPARDQPEPDLAYAPDEPLFDRRVELDAGPFADFGALSSFERVLARLPHVEDVYVRRFFDDRAIVELATTEERPLLAELREALPYRFDVEHTERSALKITLASSLAEAH